MSKLTSPFGKPLKGSSSAGEGMNSQLAETIIQSISSGAVTLNNVDITGGVISNTTIGQDGSGPGFFTSITSGSPDGIGHSVFIYGDTPGEFLNWNDILGIWTVSGDTIVTGISDLGNIRIAGNTISSTNPQGDIIIDPSGDGCLVINSCIEQYSTLGNVSFNIQNGGFQSISTEDINFLSTTGEFYATSKEQINLISNNGEVVIQSGAFKDISDISFIGVGSSPFITTSLSHNLEVGDSISISGTNSVPQINDTYTVTEIVDNFNFKISSDFPIISTGTTGSFIKNTDIFLNSSNNINIPYNVKLTFGSDDNHIVNTDEDFFISSLGDINFTPTGDINIPDSVGLTFGSDFKKIESSFSGLSIQSDSDINFTGASMSIDTTSVTLKDPILKLDSHTPILNNGLDKGIEFNYYDTSPQLGWFGYDNSIGRLSFFKQASNTNEVISGTLGDVTFGDGSFTSLNLNGGTVNAGTIDVCNLYCDGVMNITGVMGMNLNSPQIRIPQESQLKFGDTGSTHISRTGDNFVFSGDNHILLNPVNDVVLPTGSAMVFNGIDGSQNIKSTGLTELTISSSSFLNLNQVSGGVRLTENLPLIFNQNETSRITADSSGNVQFNVENSLNLIPNSGHISIPVGKRIELGSSTHYIGSTFLNQVIVNSSGTINQTSTGEQNFTSNNGQIYLNPLNSVILPANRALQLGSATEFIKSDNLNNLISSSTGSQTFISGTNINFSPSTFVSIPYSKPLQFGSTFENITGTPGFLTFIADTSRVSGNLLVQGSTTTINSSSVLMSDPILTLSKDSIAPDNKDRGIEFYYSSKLGFFGMDDTDNTFVYIPNATNQNEVITGDLGNVKFAGASLTSLVMNNGTISSVDFITSNNNLVISPGTGNDIIFNNDSGTNIVVPSMVDLVFGDETNKIFSDGTDLHIVDGLIVDGETTINGDLTVTGNINVAGGSTVNLTTHRVSVAGGNSSSPNSSSNATFITVTSPGVATGILPVASIDGFLKNIFIVSLFTGSTYELFFPTGRLLDPGTGTTVAKKIIFDCPGQSIQLLWDNVSNFYVLTQGGGEIVLV